MEKPLNENVNVHDAWYKEFSSIVVQSSPVMTIQNLLVYMKDLLLHFLTEDASNVYSVIYYTSISLIVFGLWYLLFWRTFNMNRDFTEYGFDDVKKQYPNKSDNIARKNAINELRRRRKIGDIPPVYPNGWFVILETEQLPTKTSKEINVLGLNLVAWRGESGKSYVADAYCPHLGAHLGVRGTVNGECIRCPFHGWSFEGCNGKLTNIPYSDSLIDFAKIKIWDTMEMHGFIYLWYHAEGEAPYWRPHVYNEIESGAWKYRGRSEFKIAAHNQEVLENPSDLAHVHTVHRSRCKFLKYVWKLSWAANENPHEAYKAHYKLDLNVLLFNKISLNNTEINICQEGPGLLIIEFNLPFGRAILFMMITPLEPFLQRMTHRLYSSNSILQHPVGLLILLAEAIQVSNDIVIWNRKTHFSRPILTEDDKTIKAFRKWFRQFYSENSPTYSFGNKDPNSNLVDF